MAMPTASVTSATCNPRARSAATPTMPPSATPVITASGNPTSGDRPTGFVEGAGACRDGAGTDGVGTGAGSTVNSDSVDGMDGATAVVSKDEDEGDADESSPAEVAVTGPSNDV